MKNLRSISPQFKITNSMVLKVCAFLLCSLASANIHAVYVITHTDNVIDLNKKQIRDVFMGGATKLDLVPVTLPPKEDARIQFNIKVVGLTESRIQSYWAQMRFSGRMKPPKVLNTEAEILDFVATNKDSIAYISSDIELPKGVRVIYQSL